MLALLTPAALALVLGAVDDRIAKLLSANQPDCDVTTSKQWDSAIETCRAEIRKMQEELL